MYLTFDKALDDLKIAIEQSYTKVMLAMYNASRTPKICLVTACGHRIAHRKKKEIKLQPGTAGPGNRLDCCLVSFHFLWGHHMSAGCVYSSTKYAATTETTEGRLQNLQKK